MTMPRVNEYAPAPAGALAERVVLVTGACGGLGTTTAKAAARAGATVIITGRRKRQLEQLYDAMLQEHLPEPVIHPMDIENATPADQRSGFAPSKPISSGESDNAAAIPAISGRSPADFGRLGSVKRA